MDRAGERERKRICDWLGLWEKSDSLLAQSGQCEYIMHITRLDNNVPININSTHQVSWRTHITCQLLNYFVRIGYEWNSNNPLDVSVDKVSTSEAVSRWRWCYYFHFRFGTQLLRAVCEMFPLSNLNSVWIKYLDTWEALAGAFTVHLCVSQHI